MPERTIPSKVPALRVLAMPTAALDGDGGIDVKLVENALGSRRVTWIHRNAAGDETGREEDSTDTYDPRTRPWYEGALANDYLFWTGIYIFFSQRVPGITASAKYRDPSGHLYLFGVDITLDALSHFLASLEIGRTGRAVIIDDTGQLSRRATDTTSIPQAAKLTMPLRELEVGLDRLVLRHLIECWGSVEVPDTVDCMSSSRRANIFAR